jgi:hypothetical protein
LICEIVIGTHNFRVKYILQLLQNEGRFTVFFQCYTHENKNSRKFQYLCCLLSNNLKIIIMPLRPEHRTMGSSPMKSGIPSNFWLTFRSNIIMKTDKIQIFVNYFWLRPFFHSYEGESLTIFSYKKSKFCIIFLVDLFLLTIFCGICQI